MTLAALAELEESLLALDELDELELEAGIADDAPPAELDVRLREIVPLTSDFATMGGSRPRTMF